MRVAGRGTRNVMLKSAWREKLDEHDHRAKRGTTIPRESRLRAPASPSHATRRAVDTVSRTRI